MFIIIGGDGKEYGPVTADQIRTWIKAGRANLDTKAKALGTDDWRRLGDYAEFSPPTDTPPVIPASSPIPTPPVAATTNVDTGLVMADRGTRFFARFIDWMIEFFCTIPGAVILAPEVLKLVMSALEGNEPDLDQLDFRRVAIGAAVILVARLALLGVQIWQLSTRGQSIGKRILRIRIVRIEDSSNPGFVHAWVMRELLIFAIGFALGLIPFLGILLQPTFYLVDWCLIFRDDQSCLHDIMAKTKVVKA
jgi:uncharacterized RDD family membrane protein YckC